MTQSSTIIAFNLPEQETPQQRRESKVLEVRLHLPVALNLPVKFVQIPYVVLSHDKTEWTPSDISWVPNIMRFPQIWQAMVWPLFGVVFWWMSGRSIEALVAVRQKIEGPRINLVEVAFGLSFVVLGLAICAVFTFDSYSTVREYVLAAGGGLWAILGLVMVLAGVFQWRARRQARKLIAEPVKT